MDVYSKCKRDEASGKADERAVSATSAAQTQERAGSVSTGKKNLHGTLTPATALSNSPNFDVNLPAAALTSVRSRASGAQLRHLLVKLPIRIEYNVHGGPRLSLQRGRRCLPRKDYREFDSDEEEPKRMKQEKFGDDCSRIINTDSGTPEIRLGFGRWAHDGLTWQHGLPPSQGHSSTQTTEDEVLETMNKKLKKLVRQFHPNITNQQTIDKHADYLHEQVNDMFEISGPTLWQGTRPQRPWYIHSSCSLDFGKESDRDVYVILSQKAQQRLIIVALGNCFTTLYTKRSTYLPGICNTY